MCLSPPGRYSSGSTNAPPISRSSTGANRMAKRKRFMTAVRRLSLTDFRNHRDALIEAGDGFVLLSGPNGAGKTNVLEAVSLLTPGRGLRQISIADMARSDGPGGFGGGAR